MKTREHMKPEIRRTAMRRRRPPLALPTVDLDPATAYEVLTRQMVDDLTREVTATRQRVDTMFYLIMASIAIDVLLRLTTG
jgi:hypothetical protein